VENYCTLRGIQMGFILRPDGQTLATGSKDKTIKLWNLRTGELIHTLRDSRSFGVAVSLDGQDPSRSR